MMSNSNTANFVEMQEEGFNRCFLQILNDVRIRLYEGDQLFLFLEDLLEVLIVILRVFLFFKLFDDLVLRDIDESL